MIFGFTWYWKELCCCSVTDWYFWLWVGTLLSLQLYFAWTHAIVPLQFLWVHSMECLQDQILRAITVTDNPQTSPPHALPLALRPGGKVSFLGPSNISSTLQPAKAPPSAHHQVSVFPSCLAILQHAHRLAITHLEVRI